MATQAEVDGLTGEVKQIKDNLATAKTNIEDRFSALEQSISEGKTGTSVDLSGLKDAITSLGTPSKELEDLQPVTPAPTPPSTAAPQNADGTAVEHTTDPSTAAAQAGTDAPAGSGSTPAQEDSARSQV